MSRDLTAPQLALLEKKFGLEYHTTLAVYPIDETLADKGAFYWASSAVTVRGVPYEPLLLKDGTILSALTQSADRYDAQIRPSATLKNFLKQNAEKLQNAQAELGVWLKDLRSGLVEHKIVFRGSFSSINVRRELATLPILAEVYANTLGVETLGSLCNFGYREDDRCAYAGPELTCNRRYDDPDGCAGRWGVEKASKFGGIGAGTVSALTVAPQEYSVAKYQAISDGTDFYPQQTQLAFIGATITNNETTKVTEIDLSSVGASTVPTTYYNVKTDFGATGDGTTNDTTAVQNAINACQLAGGGTVFFPAGTYKVTGLTVAGNVRLQGVSDKTSIIYSVTNAAIIATSAVDYELPKFEDLRIRGSVTAGGNQIGLKIDDATYGLRCVVRNVWIEDCGDHGLFVKRAFSSLFENIFVTNCADYPFLYDGANMPTNVFTACYVGDVRTGAAVGFRVKSGSLILYSCNGINGGSGLSTSKWAVVGKKNGVDGDATNAGATLQLVDCNLESFGTHGVHLYHSSTISVLGNTTFAGGGGPSQKAIEFEHINDGSDYYAQYLRRGYIADTIDFSDGASAYLQSQPIHANGFAPIQLQGQGPLQGGSPNAKLTTYYNSVAAQADFLPRADGNVAVKAITGAFNFTQPGVRYVELKHTAAITSGNAKLPWPGWYARAQEPLIIKDASASGCTTYNVTLTSNGGGTINGQGSYVMDTTGMTLILMPDGSGDWRVIGKYLPAGVTGVPTRIYNVVTDFAAAGNGVANDTTALQSAINAASTAGGGTVYLPRGTYNVTNLRLKSRVVLEGAGMGGTVIQGTDSTKSVLEANGTTCNFAQIRNLTVLGSGTGSNNHGIYTTSVTDEVYMFRMEHVEVKDCGGKGIFFDAMFSLSFNDVFVSNCGDNLFDLKGGNTIALYNCYADDVAANKTGYRIHRGQVTMVNCNGIDSLGSGTSWAIFGDKTSEDGVDAYVDAILMGCNAEEFKLYGVRCKEGSRAEYYATFFTASSSGSAHVAILHDYTGDNPGVLASSCRFNTNGGTWANSLPIHSGNDMPVLCLGHNNQTQYYYDGGASAQTLLGVDITSLGGSRYVSLGKGAMNEIAFPTDNSGDIGPNESYRPRDVNAGRYVRAGGYVISGDGFISQNWSNSPSAATLWIFRRHRGTSGSPTAVQSGDTLGYIEFDGQYDTTDGHRNAGAYITVATTQNFSSTAAGTKVEITAAPNNSTNGFAEGVRLAPTTNAFEPIANNGLDLGSASYNWQDLYVGRMMRAGGSAPTSSTGTGAGTGPTLVVDGNSISGAIVLTTGTSPATNAKIWDITVPAAFANYPVPMLTAGNAVAATAIAEGRIFVDDSLMTSTKWTVKSSASVALAASTEYIFYYHVIGF